MRKYIAFALISTLCGFGGAWIFQYNTTDTPSFMGNNNEAGIASVSYNAAGGIGAEFPDFIHASTRSTSGVVFIKTQSQVQISSPWDDWFSWDMFGRRGKVSSSGSGVIISEDGYIVTNNHVVAGAETIDVILNNNRYSYKAKIIGTDPSTDLALLKIEAKKLPKISFGNSDQLEIGEWVLAVGNPFNLTSTVTAGIVSAKGRNINIVNNTFPIESFIQTDAAINPGNSGGALVNLKGELVGINTAIASKTGSYNGYGFAIPSNIVGKIVKDLIEFGEVQRAFTGMDAVDITAELFEKAGNEDKGVYVAYVAPDGPAKKAGIKEGDVVIKINGHEVNTKATFDEQIAYHRPGDKILLTLLHAGKTTETALELVNREGTTELLKRNIVTSASLGADFEMISKIEKDRYGVTSGIRVTNIRGGLMRKMNIPDGFVFVKLNNNSYASVNEFIKDMEAVRGRIVIEGINPNGVKQFLSFYYY